MATARSGGAVTLATPPEWRLGGDTKEALAHLRKADPKLGVFIERAGPCTIELKSTHNTFAALAEAIVYQQLHGKAAATIFGRFRALYAGRRFPTPEQVLATPEATLRGAGLSRNKMLAIVDLAAKVQSGVVPSVAALRRMSNDEIVERLTAVRGIGRWTVEMLLIFRLGRPDVLPVDDYGVRKGCAVLLRKKALPSPAELARYGERWKPYRSVASWYLWRAAEGAPLATIVRPSV
jgi:DNA-3-methyladenine glycosylase II